MGLIQAGLNRVSLRRAGATAGVTGGTITSIVPGAGINVTGGTGPTATVINTGTIALAYSNGASAANQTATIAPANGGPITLDASGAVASTRALIVKQSTALGAVAPIQITGNAAGAGSISFISGAGVMTSDAGIALESTTGNQLTTAGLTTLSDDTAGNIYTGKQSAQVLVGATGGYSGIPVVAAAGPTAIPAGGTLFTSTPQFQAPLMYQDSNGGADANGCLLTYDNLTQAWRNVEPRANWTTAGIRVYAIDFVNGNDSNRGYADSLDITSGNYQAACAAAGANAKKTVAGLARIIPQLGENRRAEIVCANGGVNTVEAYADTLNTLVSGVSGYQYFTVRGTGTNVNAGAVAFDGTQNDVTYLGAVTGTGLSALGYNPTGAPTTTTMTCQINGGGAPGFAAEPAVPCGLRIRFRSTTGTVALRNVCKSIAQVTGGNQLTWSGALAAVPALTDVFDIEQAGVTFTGLSTRTAWGNPAAVSSTLQLDGIGFTGTVIPANGNIAMAFCQGTAYSGQQASSELFTTLIQHPVYGNLQIGGTRWSSTWGSSDGGPSCSNMTVVGTTSFNRPRNCSVTGGCTFGANVTVVDPKCSVAFPNVGSTTAVVGAKPRVIGGGAWIFQGSGSFRIDQLDVSNSASSGIYLAGNGNGPGLVLDLGSFNANNSITGTGNTVAGMYTAFSKQATFLLNAAVPPTITGVQNLYLASNLPVAWAAVVNGGLGFRDVAGNVYIGVNTSGNGTLVGSSKLKFSGTLLGGAGAVFAYISDDGEITPGANNTNPLSYPMDQFQIISFKVKPRTNTMTQNVTATVYQNGVATGATVTIPAGSTAVQTFNIPTALVLFNSNDLMDVRLDAAAADAGHSIAVSCLLTSP